MYDLYDCCHDYINDYECDVCLCHASGTRHSSIENCSNSLISDGFCHDSCNFEETIFDGGDCCLPRIDATFCFDCLCFETLKKHTQSLCSQTQIGNYRCQDVCNLVEYDYDGLDCCGDVVDHTMCEDCVCHLSGSKHPIVGGECLGKAQIEKELHIIDLWILGLEIANGICNEKCNYYINDYDGLDCCLDYVTYEPFRYECQRCSCHLDNQLHPENVESCKNVLLGDKVCHDQCNFQEFSFDFNDCCLEIIDDTDCNDCACHIDDTRRQSCK